MKKICAIAAMDRDRVIGRDGALPWHLPEDLKRFKQLTMGHSVLMGRKTFESIPPNFRPLTGRINMVLTSSPSLFSFPAGVRVYTSVKEAIEEFPEGLLWIIGGARVYRESVSWWDEVFLTLLEGKHEGDAFFPEFEDRFELADKEPGKECEFLHYVRRS